jgi:hypothetical protein
LNGNKITVVFSRSKGSLPVLLPYLTYHTQITSPLLLPLLICPCFLSAVVAESDAPSCSFF